MVASFPGGYQQYPKREPLFFLGFLFHQKEFLLLNNLGKGIHQPEVSDWVMSIYRQKKYLRLKSNHQLRILICSIHTRVAFLLRAPIDWPIQIPNLCFRWPSRFYQLNGYRLILLGNLRHLRRVQLLFFHGIHPI